MKNNNKKSYSTLMSQDELVDIVDKDGNFLEVVSKKLAHEKGLLHKCVIANVIDSQGKWLLTRPSNGRQDMGQYVSPMGGHVRAGETDIDALKRELMEELSLSDFKYEFAGKAIFDRHVIGRHENHFFLVYKVFSDAKPVLSHEAASCKHFIPEELQKELKENPQLFGDAFHFVVRNIYPYLLQ